MDLLPTRGAKCGDKQETAQGDSERICGASKGGEESTVDWEES